MDDDECTWKLNNHCNNVCRMFLDSDEVCYTYILETIFVKSLNCVVLTIVPKRT